LAGVEYAKDFDRITPYPIGHDIGKSWHNEKTNRLSFNGAADLGIISNKPKRVSKTARHVQSRSRAIRLNKALDLIEVINGLG
jgi:hypothetical protein